MLFKKNKPDKPQSPLIGNQDPPALSGGDASVFAPGLNTRSAPIDFGFDRVPVPPQPQSYIVPPPPPDQFSQPEVSSSQSDWNAGLPVDTQPFFEQPQNIPMAYSDSAPTSPVETLPPSAGWGAANLAEPENTAYLGETFESYVAESPVPESYGTQGADLSSGFEQGLDMEAANAWQLPDFGGDIPNVGAVSHSLTESAFESELTFSLDEPMGMPHSTHSQPVYPQESGLGDFLPAFDESVPLEANGATFSTEAFSPVSGEVMPWEQASVSEPPAVLQSSAEALHYNLEAGNALPGEQISVSPGALLDTMHQQFYPEDPFGVAGLDPLDQMNQGDVLAGQQAFEDAAEFLFPDTVSAPLDWQPEETPTLAGEYGLVPEYQMPVGDVDAFTPLELGPSVQRNDSDISDLSGFDLPLPTAGLDVDPFFSESPELVSFSGEPTLEAGPIIGEYELTAFNSELLASPELAPPEMSDTGGWASPEFALPTAGSEIPLSQPVLSEPVEPVAYTVTQQGESDFSEWELPTGLESSISELGAGTEPWQAAAGSADLDLAFAGAFSEVEPAGFSDSLSEPVLEIASEAPPVIAIETVPLDPFGDMETIHWDPQVAEQAILEELLEESGQPSLAPTEPPFEALPDLGEYNLQDNWMVEPAALNPAGLGMETLVPPDLAPNVDMEAPGLFTPELPHSQPEVSFIQPISDQDFYATEFTLNELGELVPVMETDADAELTLPTEPAPMASPAFSDTGLPAVSSDWAADEPEPTVGESGVSGYQETDFDPAALYTGTPEHFGAAIGTANEEALFAFNEPEALPTEAGLTAFGFEPAESEVPEWVVPPLSNSVDELPPFSEPEPVLSPFSQVVIPSPLPSHSMPSMGSPAGIALPDEASAAMESLRPPAGSLEAQWQEASHFSDSAPAAAQPGTVTPPAAFSLGNLEVLGVCALAADRRLLVVQSNGVYALMGQVGLENPDVSVLKVFETNPLAYQNTFTAVEEVQAAAQGMFVTQVGTWHGIVSTFQDKIILHTELG